MRVQSQLALSHVVSHFAMYRILQLQSTLYPGDTYEDHFVAIVAQDPVCVAERRERVGAEIGGLQAGRATARDAEGFLKVLV
jgi:hypothetical protein